MTRAGATVVAGALALAVGVGPAMAGEKGAPWSYEGQTGPEHWGDLSPEYVACKLGAMQSPIDLAGANAGSAVTVSFDYKPVALEVLNNGHTVQLNVANGSMMASHGQSYELLQVHFHTPSEHVADAAHYPMEAHFVHRRADGALAVIGVLFTEGRANAALSGLYRHLPKQEQKAKKYPSEIIEPRAIIPANPSFYRYMGSLTTPPCSEGVNWFIAGAVAEASKAQLAAMAAVLRHNARPAQPLNHRLVLAPAK